MADQINGQRTTYLIANDPEEAAGFGLEWGEDNRATGGEDNRPIIGVLAYDGEKTIASSIGPDGQPVARVFHSGDEIFEPIQHEADGSRGASIPVYHDGKDMGHLWIVASAQNDAKTIAHNHEALPDNMVDPNHYEMEHGAYPGGVQSSWTVHEGNEENVGAVATPEQASALLAKAMGIGFDAANAQIIYSDAYLEHNPELAVALEIPKGVVNAVDFGTGGDTLDLDAILGAGSPATPNQGPAEAIERQ